MRARLFFMIGFSLCALMIGTAYFLQYGLGLEPCPLCILTRVAVFLSLVLFGTAALHNPKRMGQKIYALLTSLSVLLGLGLSSRHIYLQHLPAEQVPDCGPGFDYLIKNFPLSEALQVLFHGSGQCAEVSAQFIGLSLAEWTGIALAGLFVWSLAPFLGFIKNP